MAQLIHLAGMAIRTAHVWPPIPIRDFDWYAHDDNQGEDGPHASGETEAEAVAELVLYVRDDWPDRADKDGAWVYRLNCMAEDVDSSPIMILASRSTLRVQHRPPLFSIGV